MKRILWVVVVALAVVSVVRSAPAGAASIGKATADFDNARPDRAETAWGRLVADAVRAAGHADIAVVNAGALQRGTLKAGAIEAADVSGLLNFGDDEVVAIKISGAQLRQALERSAEVYPTGSPDFLQCSGFTASFNPQARPKSRVTAVRYQGRAVTDGDSFTAAMPVSLASGAGGYFKIWNGQTAQHTGSTLQVAVVGFIHARGQVTPDGTPRFGPS